MLDLDLLERELLDAAGDAGIAPASLVVFVVEARRPPGTTPIAYLQPAGVLRPDTVLVFRAAGAGRVAAHRLRAHRLALWHELPGVPAAALAPMLRHELEHARRFERSGPRFFEADDLVRAAFRNAGPAVYASLPSEREANAAAGFYARSRLSADELAAVAAWPEGADLVALDQGDGDVVEATLALLPRMPGAGDGALEAYGGEVRAACEAWSRGRGFDLVDGRDAPLLELVDPDPEAVAVWAAP
jgi:hypothetical protein